MTRPVAEAELPGEKCGVVGMYLPGEDAARETFFALFALQHRGQESAGICTSDGESLHYLTGMGLVTQVFNERDLRKLSGPLAIGHTRYSTTGASRAANAQPFVVSGDLGTLALAHNGNVLHTRELRARARAAGAEPRTGTDSELIAHLIARADAPDWLARVLTVLPMLEGAYSLTLLTHNAMYAARDPWGIRPLVIGRLKEGWIVASESCALDTLGAQLLREVEPGEVIQVTAEHGLVSTRLERAEQRAGCTFEHIYFARPDSILDGTRVYTTRERMGEQLAREHPIDADLVMPVPDSATPAAIGYARAANIPYREGLVKNRYIGRTFIQPQQDQREAGVNLKFNPLPEVLCGQRVVLVDDSIVRGTTTPRIVAMLRRSGAREIHLRITAPPVRHACYLGVDTAPEETLIASQHSVEEIRQIVGADSLGYLSLEGLVDAIGLPSDQLCNACFHGNHPVDVRSEQGKLALEVG